MRAASMRNRAHAMRRTLALFALNLPIAILRAAGSSVP